MCLLTLEIKIVCRDWHFSPEELVRAHAAWAFSKDEFGMLGEISLDLQLVWHYRGWVQIYSTAIALGGTRSSCAVYQSFPQTREAIKTITL